MRPDDSGIRRPTVLFMTGGDGTAERLYFNGGGAAGLRRGYNVLCFEGPGQSGAYMLDNSLVFRYDYEVPIGAVIDYAVSRPDVDPDRIAAIGYSMGGYFAPGPRRTTSASRPVSRTACCPTPTPRWSRPWRWTS